ncbi:MAG: hypothetical protein HDR82_09695 [Bacteroides sp.]|nr:hypothetical protein [Bacteroides sp.]
MADDKLIFPIGFDLEAAVKGAGDDWDKKYAERLEKLIAKRPINVKLNLDTSKLDSLDAVKKRLAELKLEPVTPETKRAIKELAGELRTLAKALEAVQKYSRVSTRGAVDASRVRVNEERAKAQSALAAQRAARAEYNLAAARERDARAAARGAAATQGLNRAYQSQDSLIWRLTKRLAVYAGLQKVKMFLTSVRSVTAEFELQRVSLGAIIQDQQRANQLFSEIKNFALKSPVSILDLTKYTKQLAAYKIGVDELFETTKKLTDVSVGLGVSMDRVVLAYGQTRATGYLRASEIRQFTEMGVPIVEELAAKLSKMNGELVTAAQVMDMVSKRAISFELVKEVFDDMTSAGGMFYNMQEKQGNTLAGMWAKLGDAASVMYDQIGNNGTVNAAMRGTIELLTEMMRNWREVGSAIGTAGAALAAFWAANKVKSVVGAWQGGIDSARVAANNKLTAAQNAYNVALQREAVALKQEAALTQNSSNAIKANAYARTAQATASRVSAKAALEAAFAESRAAQSTNLWTKATNKLKTALSRNWLTMLLALVAAIGFKVYDVLTKTDELEKKLRGLDAEARTGLEQSILTFERLTKTITESTDGSRQQREALQELHNTFGKMIPVQDMTIERLRAMKGNYEQLTVAIREYAAEQLQINKANALIEEQGVKLKEINKQFENANKGAEFQYRKEGQGWQKIELSADDVKRIKTALEEFSKDTSLSFDEAITKALESVTGFDVDESYISKVSNLYIPFMKLYNTVHETYSRIDEESELTMRALNADLLSYANRYERVFENIKNAPITAKKGTFEYDQEVERVKVREYVKFLQEVFEREGLTFDISTMTMMDGEQMRINWDAVNDELDKGASKTIESAKLATAKLQREYVKWVPQGGFVNTMRDALEQITGAMGGNMDKMKRFLAQGGDDLDSYRKKLQEWLEERKAYIQQENVVVENYGKGVGVGVVSPESIEKTKETIKEAKLEAAVLEAFLNRLPAVQNGGGRGDGRVQTLQEMERALVSMLDKYEELEKRVGSVRASEYIDKTYRQELEYLNELAGEFGLKFDAPKTIKELNRYQTEIWNALGKINTVVARRAQITLGKSMDARWLKNETEMVDKKLKELSDRISRTKTAREFYDKILSQTGDVDLAASVTMSVYGDTGEGLFDNIVEQIRQSFTSGDAGIDMQITADIDAAIDTTNQRINYEKLAEIYEKYQADIIEKNRDTAQNIVSEGQKTAAANILTWEKELAKAKDYEEQRTDIINRETQRRAEIYKSNLPQDEKDRLAAQSRTKQDKDVAKVNFEEFTKSEDYIKIFENLDNTSTAALKRLREEMRKLIDTNKDLSPENMKTLVKAMEDIDEQISGRGFGNDMVQSVRDYMAALRDLKTARAELNTAQAEYEEQLPKLDADISMAEEERLDAETSLLLLKKDGLATEEQILAAELRLNNAEQAVTNAEQAKAKAAEKVKEAEAKVTEQQDKQKKATNKFFKDLQNVASAADQLANTLGDVKDLLGISEDSAAGLVFDAAIGSLQTMSKAIGVVTTAQALFNAIAESNPYIAIAAGVLAVGAAIGSWISGNKVRKANKEIERQKELLDQLEYTYGRLEKAAENVFGAQYIDNYDQQLRNLQAQQEAYMKQAEAERSKGKKADKDKIKEYEEAAREAADNIKDMQAELTAHFTGSSRADAARQMAQSWIDARASMSDTFTAIKEDYADLVKNMIVEGAAARVIENALTPMWQDMDKMLADNDVEGAIDAIMKGMDSALAAANNGMEVLWKSLEARGYDMKALLGESDGEYTGIKREVAGATSEEMNANTAALNAQNYYVSHLPGMAVNVAAIRQLMEGGKVSALPSSGAVSGGWTDWQQQAMDSYMAIQRNTADTVVECRRAAVAAENAVAELRRVIRPRGSQSVHSLHVTID